MSKRSRYDKSKNRSRKQNNIAVLMAMCVIAGLGSIVLGSMSRQPAVIGAGTVAAGLGLTISYQHYQSLNPASKRTQRTNN